MGVRLKAYEYSTLQTHYNKRPINIRAGLLTVALMMEQLDLAKHLDDAFPKPKSNRAIAC